MNRLEVLAPDGVGEVVPGDDLAVLLAEAVALRDGDLVAVTSKVVSKAEGMQRRGRREDLLDAETARVVARRGETRIVRTRHGLTLAAAGIDASNVAAGTVLLLPRDPDASARRIRAALARRPGVNVGVLVTDTAGRAWRDGQTDIAVGAAGVVVAEDHAGHTDAHGNPLVVTRPAVADEVASAAELAQGKLAGRPFAVLRGRADLVLPAGRDGPGATALVRPEAADLFGYGAREAVVRALAGDAADQSAFGSPAPLGELLQALARAFPGEPPAVRDRAGPDGEPDLVVEAAGARLAGLRTLCFAHGWRVEEDPGDTGTGGGVRLRPVTP